MAISGIWWMVQEPLLQLPWLIAWVGLNLMNMPLALLFAADDILRERRRSRSGAQSSI